MKEEKGKLILDSGKFDISLQTITQRFIRFPHQPSENLIEFCHADEIVARIDSKGKFECFDKKKLIDVLISVPKAFQEVYELNRQARMNELKLKYPQLYEEKEG